MKISFRNTTTNTTTSTTMFLLATTTGYFLPENLRINNESPVHSNVILTDNAHYDEPMFRFLLQDMWK